MKHLYIAGDWVPASDGGTAITINPADERPLETLAEATAGDVARADLPQAERGGFGTSGIGRELGPSGLEEYQEKKHIYHNTAPAPSAWFAG